MGLVLFQRMKKPKAIELACSTCKKRGRQPFQEPLRFETFQIDRKMFSNLARSFLEIKK